MEYKMKNKKKKNILIGRIKNKLNKLFYVQKNYGIKETKRLVINVNLSRVLYNTNDYEAAITAGRQYSMFTSTTTNITSKSSITSSIKNNLFFFLRISIFKRNKISQFIYSI
jgi:hypothetical protein